MHSAVRALGIALVIGLYPAGTASAQHVTLLQNGTVSVSAREIPLDQLLAEFGRLVPISIQVDGDSGAQLVTATFEPANPLVALRQVLLTAGVNFMIAARASGEVRVRIAGATPQALASVGSETVAAADAPPAIEIAADLPPPERPEPADTPAGPPAEDVAPAQLPGLRTADQLTRLLTPSNVASRKPPRGNLPLPFPGADGQPLQVWNEGVYEDVIALPFPDSAGGQQMIARPAPAAPHPDQDESPSAAPPRQP